MCRLGGATSRKGDMADFSDFRARANRIRAATESLTDTRDLQVVQDYLTELEILAAEQDAAPPMRSAVSAGRVADQSAKHWRLLSFEVRKPYRSVRSL